MGMMDGEDGEDEGRGAAAAEDGIKIWGAEAELGQRSQRFIVRNAKFDRFGSILF